MKLKASSFLPFWIACLIGFSGIAGLNAQEENLQRAMKDRERRVSGLTSLAKKIQNLVYKYVPGVEPEEEEEVPTVSPGSTQVSVEKVELVKKESETEEGILPVDIELPGESEEDIYMANLQMATSKLKIQGTFPKTKQIMVGAKNLGVGDQIAIQFKGEMFNLSILDVTSNQLKLRDQKTEQELNMAIGVSKALPPGMFKSPPPGMMPEVAPEGTAPPAPPAPPATTIAAE